MCVTCPRFGTNRTLNSKEFLFFCWRNYFFMVFMRNLIYTSLNWHNELNKEITFVYPYIRNKGQLHDWKSCITFKVTSLHSLQSFSIFFIVLLCFCFVLFSYFPGWNQFMFLHTFFHNYDNYSMVRDVLQCSMFQILSTTINNKADYVFF